MFFFSCCFIIKITNERRIYAKKIHTNISNEFDDVNITVEAPKLDQEVQLILDTLSNLEFHNTQQIIGNLDNQVYIIPIEDILCFYSDEKYNYCQTIQNNYKLRNTLYELEQNLNKDNWIRISNSCIVNINQIKYFDMGTIGSVVVVLKNGTTKDVSKRRIKDITQLLKLRRGLK